MARTNANDDDAETTAMGTDGEDTVGESTDANGATNATDNGAGNGQTPGGAFNAQEFAALERLQTRRAVASYLGQQYGGDRDIYDVAGYERSLDTKEFWAKYDRGDIAETIIDRPPEESWGAEPVITDDPDTEEISTPFDEAIRVLFDQFSMLTYWERVDRLAGLGQYAVLYIGFADADDAELDEEVDDSGFTTLDNFMGAGFDPDIEESGLAFFAPYGQERAPFDEETDVRSPRFGFPVEYDIEFDTGDATMTNPVHWSRVIHVAEGVLEDEVHGRPRLQSIYNRLEDLEKVMAGSAEMFWRSAAPRYVANTREGSRDVRDKDELKDEIDSMIHGMDMVAYLRNIELTTLDGQAVDPSGMVDQILKLIAGETGIPKRILTGSERGELASTQDRATFFERIGKRQRKFCEPAILRPTIDRLINLGILPEPEGGTYVVEWPNLFELNEIERAQVRKTNTEAIKAGAPMGDPGAVVTIPELREEFLGLPPERGAATTIDTPDIPGVDDDTMPGADPDADMDDDEELRELFDRIMDGDVPEGVDVIEVVDGRVPTTNADANTNTDTDADTTAATDGGDTGETEG